MTNAYRKFMKQQHMSEQAKQAFYYNLQRTGNHKKHSFIPKIAIVAACILILVSATVYAAENIFGISFVKVITGVTSNGQSGTGYEVTYPVFDNRPLSDFSEEIQRVDGYKLETYSTWQQAEKKLGLTLVNNSFLQGEMLTKAYAYDLKEEGIYAPVHCYASYTGEDHQLYRAEIAAAYGYKNIYITIRTIVTCAHPAISQEEMQQMHGSSVIYKTENVEKITQEQYTAANGVKATVVTVDQIGGKPTRYEAGFSANGASYRITVNGSRTGQDEEAKNTLIQILEGFVF